MKRWFIGIAVVVVVGFIGWFFLDGVQNSDSVQENEETAVAVTVAYPSIRDIKTELVYHGTLQAKAQVPVVPKASGTVAEIFVRVGDIVVKDQVLAQLDAEETRLQAAQAQAGLAAAEAALARARSGARPEEIEQAEAGLRQAQANYDSAKSHHDRSKILYEEGVLSRAEWEGIVAQLEVAEAGLSNARNAVAIARQGAHPDDLRSAEASVEQARAAASLAQLAVDHATIKAPISGSVSQWQLEAGAMVGTGSPVGMIVDADILRLPIQVGSRDVVRMEAGQTVHLTVEALPGYELNGYVATISPAADMASGLFPVTLEFDNIDQRVRAGMYATAHVQIETLSNVLTVPARALRNNGGESQVFVVEQNRAHRRTVELGSRSGDYIQILEGLTKDDAVVVVGGDGLRADALVSVQNRIEEGQ